MRPGEETWTHLVFLQKHHCDNNVLHRKCPLKTGKTGLAVYESHVLKHVRKYSPRLQTLQGKGQGLLHDSGSNHGLARIDHPGNLFSMQ